ncbi:MAG: vitamin K epoxide reductase family protein [Candidatus Egerieousia sp.]
MAYAISFMGHLVSKKTEMQKLLSKIFATYNIKATKRGIQNTILQNPSYPTLSCVSDALDLWKVKYIIAKLTLEKLSELGIPVLSSLEGTIIWITRITNENVYFRNVGYVKKRQTIDSFSKIWNGVVIIIEPDNDAEEPDFKQKSNSEKRRKGALAILAISLSGLLLISSHITWMRDMDASLTSKTALLLNNLAGFFVSALLYRRNKLIIQDFSDSFCKRGKFVDCDAVHGAAKKSMITFYLEEIGLSYFLSMIMWLIFSPSESGWIFPVYITAIISIPIIILSIFAQFFLIKKVCILCCAVSSILALNVCLSLFLHTDYSYLHLLKFIGIFCVILFAILSFTAAHTRKTSNYALKRQLSRIKSDKRTILAHLDKLAIKTPTPGFSFGETDSKIEVAIFVTFGCQYCKKIITDLQRLWRVYPDLHYNLIFRIDSTASDIERLMIKELYDVYKQGNMELFFAQVLKIYSADRTVTECNLDAQNTKSQQDTNYDAVVNSLTNFSESAKTDHWPAIYINGRLLSAFYDRKDLLILLQSLSKF